MKNKTLLYVGIGVAVLGAGYFLLRPKKDTNLGGGYVPPNNQGGAGQTGQAGGNQTTGQALLNIASGLDWNSILNIGGKNNIQNVPDSVPFENATEGNAFRGWVNDNYPAYAQEIDLDRTGSYNNSYITKAYQKYGAEYNQAMNNSGGQTSWLANLFARNRARLGDVAFDGNDFSDYTSSYIG
ncbi:MAG TPA: hypothetical protein DCM40_38445 [Maribacter sp.]|nr:hypothetical protein [Maribacter sp.]|tara:strand:+ start:2506 stop:3054 length:549 start_codon:yes stop_codon:yes gene_type:complete